MREGSKLDLTSMCVKVCKYLRKTFCLSNKQFSCQKRWRFEGKNRSGLKLNTHEVVSLRSGIFSTLNILNRFNSVDKTLKSSAKSVSEDFVAKKLAKYVRFSVFCYFVIFYTVCCFLYQMNFRLLPFYQKLKGKNVLFIYNSSFNQIHLVDDCSAA